MDLSLSPSSRHASSLSPSPSSPSSLSPSSPMESPHSSRSPQPHLFSRVSPGGSRTGGDVTSGSHHHSSVFHFESGLSDLISHIEFDAQRGFVEDVEHSESLAISISGLEMWLERNLIRCTSAICKRCYTLIANGGEVKPHKWLALTDKESCGALASLT